MGAGHARRGGHRDDGPVGVRHGHPGPARRAFWERFSDDAFTRRAPDETAETEARAFVRELSSRPQAGGRVTLVDAATGARTEAIFPDDPAASPFVAQVEAFAASLLRQEPFPFPARATPT